MFETDNEKDIVVCCERMLMELGHTIHLDSIQWPHLEDAIAGPTLAHCPWCSKKMPFGSEVE